MQSPLTLVTGLKRGIALLARVPAVAGDEVLVCDLSMERNLVALVGLLDRGVRVRYFDHHALLREIPKHPGLESTIVDRADVCTCILMDRAVDGAARAWAAMGAYGDNLPRQADELASAIGLDVEQRRALRRLGEAINYNAYGDDERDVLIAPSALYRVLTRWHDPLQVLEHEAVVAELEAARLRDLREASMVAPIWRGPSGSVLALPDKAWARRIVGFLANDLTNREPNLAHAILTPAGQDHWRVSVRAPRAAPGGADALCRQFGGLGRAVAAGIERLSGDKLGHFLDAFAAERWGDGGCVGAGSSRGISAT